MPFPVSHTITGLIFARSSPQFPEKIWYKEIALIAFLANLPDFDFALVWVTGDLTWHRTFSHSLLFAFFIGAVTCLFYRTWSNSRWLVLSSIVFSHTLLDFFTSSSSIVKGAMIFWPVSQARFTADLIHYPMHNWRVYQGLELALKMIVMAGLELVIYLPIFFVIVLVRRFVIKIFLKEKF